MIINLIIGLLLGAAAKPISDIFTDKLLKARGKELKQKKENLIIHTLLSALLGAGIGASFGISLQALFVFLLLLIGNIVSTSDIACRIIPNETVLAILLIKLLFGVTALLKPGAMPSWNPLLSLAGFAVMTLIFLLPALKGGKVGAGDIKLAMAVGFSSELMPGLLAVVFMGVLVLVYGFVQKRIPVLGRLPLIDFMKTSFPMGPFLCAAQIGAMLCCGAGLIIAK